jgi:hypothetical protein
LLNCLFDVEGYATNTSNPYFEDQLMQQFGRPGLPPYSGHNGDTTAAAPGQVRQGPHLGPGDARSVRGISRRDSLHVTRHTVNQVLFVIDAQVTVALCYLGLLVSEYLGNLQEGCPDLRQIGGAGRETGS